MLTIEDRFRGLGVDHAPGQEVRASGDATVEAIGANLEGAKVDFSHGDVDADAFEPTPGSIDAFVDGFRRGGAQAYTEYRGDSAIRERVAQRLSAFTGGVPIDAGEELIVTPGTQGALFLAVLSTVAPGDQVAIVQPDYFANRKLVEFVGAQAIPVRMDYLGVAGKAGIDLGQLESAFRQGAKTFLFSNPCNPTGAIYSASEIAAIARLATAHGVTVIADQLYSRMLYAGEGYTHLRASDIDPGLVVTIMGPSKTESLSGFRLGVAFGAPKVVSRMEKLQAIVSLRAPGYCQAVLDTWFAEPAGWLAARIAAHQAIRDDLLDVFRSIEGVRVRTPQAGSYLFPQLPPLSVPPAAFVRLLRSQAGVTVTPGSEFSPHATDSIRLNFSQNRARALHGAQRIAAMVERYRG